MGWPTPPCAGVVWLRWLRPGRWHRWRVVRVDDGVYQQTCARCGESRWV